MLSRNTSPRINLAAQSPITNSSKELPQSAQQAKRLFSDLEATKDGLLHSAKPLALIFEDEDATDEEDISSAENSPTSSLRKHFTDLDFDITETTKKNSAEEDIAQQNSKLILACTTIADLTLLAICAMQSSDDTPSQDQLSLLCQQTNALINFAASITPNDNPYGQFQAMHSGPNTRENWLRNSMQNISSAFPTILINALFVTEATALADNYRTRSASMKTTAPKDAKQIPVSDMDNLEHNEELQNLRERLNSQSLKIQPPISDETNSSEILLEIDSSEVNAEGVVKDRHDLKCQINSKCSQVFWQGNPALQFRDLKRSHDKDTNNIDAVQRKSARVTRP
jgi:hypothetical protein